MISYQTNFAPVPGGAGRKFAKFLLYRGFAKKARGDGPLNIAIYTLGCKVNQYETQALEQLLTERGHTLVSFEEAADTYIINTCSVTAVSDKKSRQMIRRARKQAPDAIVAVCGCYPQTHPEEMADLPVDLIAGTGDRRGFLDLLEREWQDRRPITALDNAFDRRTFEALPAGGLEGRTRCLLKIEDGCVNFCSYCIIPYARGRVRSLPAQEAAEEARRLAAEGYREIVLTGIEISSWGQDLPGDQNLCDLLEAVCAALPEDVRLRLGSLEPRTITEDFCKRAAALPQLCPHFHLSLQSGCDTVLKRMNRKYGTQRYYESVTLLRQYFDDPAITTDLITGFPGETEEEFSDTLAFIRRCGFADMHIFPYSIRPGTPAAKMEQVPKAVKEERCARAAETAAEMHRDYLRRWVGRQVPVLFEERGENGLWRGHAPNYMVVEAEGEDLHNRTLTVTLTGIDGEVLQGTL